MVPRGQGGFRSRRRREIGRRTTHLRGWLRVKSRRGGAWLRGRELGKLPGCTAVLLRGSAGVEGQRGGVSAAAQRSMRGGATLLRRLGLGGDGIDGRGAGWSAGWFKQGAGISACALKKETGGVLGRGSRLAVARPGEVGKTGLARRARAVSESGVGRAGRALCGRVAPTGGPGASVGAATSAWEKLGAGLLRAGFWAGDLGHAREARGGGAGPSGPGPDAGCCWVGFCLFYFSLTSISNPNSNSKQMNSNLNLNSHKHSTNKTMLQHDATTKIKLMKNFNYL